MFNRIISIDGTEFSTTNIGYRHEESFTDAQGTVAKSIVGTNNTMVQPTSQDELDSLKKLANGEPHEIEFPNGIRFNSTVTNIADSSFYVSEK